MTKYIISPITTYNEEEQLFETKIGLDDKDMTLHYLVYGKSDQTSKDRAKGLIELLNAIITDNYRSSC